MSSKRVGGETTIKTSIRIRPCSQQERDAYPGPSPVQAAPGEVRLFQRPFLPASGRNSPSSMSRSPRPGTPTSPHITPRGPSSPSVVWRQQAAAAQAQLSNEYQSYPFANVFGAEEGNEDVYNGSGCRDVVGAVLGGCNGTIFVYGQTGAGKTFTMDAVTDLVLQQLYAATEDSSSEVAISVSAVELYNEVLRCLLSGRENLQLRWASGAGSVNGVVLEGAEERPCGSIEEAAALVTMAKASRAVGETRANARSSRSHLIVRIKVEVLQLSNLALASPPASPTRRGSFGTGAKRLKPPPATVSFSMLNLVDLAGSERIDKTGSSDTPLRLREALNINKSLLCLGNVVTALAERAEGKRGSHIPYRDSKLTRLLEDSLGGNATTALIACITPLPDWNLEQSRNTLEFAARAARIVCKPQRNVLDLAPRPASGEAANLIASLQAEVAALKKQLAEQHQHLSSPLASPQLHALSVHPVSSSNALWDSCSILTSRGSGALAGVAESAAEGGAGDLGEGVIPQSPVSSASCPSSPNGRHSPFSRGRSGGWTNRLRMSLGGSSVSADGSAGAQPTSPDSKSSSIRTSLHLIPSRIPTPKHSLFSSLTSPRASGKQSSTATSDHSQAQPDSPSSSAAASTIRTHPAQAAQADGGVINSSGQGAALPASAHTTSILSRASGTQKSLLWKLLQQPHTHDRMSQSSLIDSSMGSANGSMGSIGHGSQGGPHSTQSLKSTGLLITSSGNAATAAAAVAANAVGAFARWATFSGGRSSPVSSATATASLNRAETHDGISSSLVGPHASSNGTTQLSPQASLVYTGRSSIVSRRITTDGTTGAGSSTSSSMPGMLASGGAGGHNNKGLDSACTSTMLESRVTAAEAAMALRDHIIKQLVLALQQKKAEIRSLKEQLAAVLKQLENSEGEEQTNKTKLRELAEGIQVLAAARQEEFEKWKGHLVGLESALQAAQKEATNYRDESQSLVQQLTELQTRYDNLQTTQHNSLMNVSVVQAASAEQHNDFSQEQQQLSDCLKRLQTIEASLQHMLKLPPQSLTQQQSRRYSPRSRARTPSPHPPQDRRRSSRSPSPCAQDRQHQQQQQDAMGMPAGTVVVGGGSGGSGGSGSPVLTPLPVLFPSPAGLAGRTLEPRRSTKGGDVPSHCIQTVTTRVYDGGSSPRTALPSPRQQQQQQQQPSGLEGLAKAAEEAATAARLSHIEFVLAELQEVMPLVKAVAEAASMHVSVSRDVSMAGGQTAAAGRVSALGSNVHTVLHTGTADNPESQRQDQAAQTKEAKASLAGGMCVVTADKCHKCDSLKPLLVIMQKLKDEVVLLKAAVRTRDSKLAEAEETAADLKADLLESKQQVGALRERIDELSEDLEVARSAAAAAVAAQDAAAAAATDESASNAAATAAAAAGAAAQPDSCLLPGSSPGGAAAAANAAAGSKLSSGREGASSSGRQVPLMGEDTPLEALHAQILQSWQALAMPFQYRCAFVLGPCHIHTNSSSSADNSSSKACDGSTVQEGISGSRKDDPDNSGSTSDDAAADTGAGAAPNAAAAPAADGASGGVLLEAPWHNRAQCQAHIALLACLHQYQEDEPAAARQQQEVLEQEARVVEAGLAQLPVQRLAELLECCGVAADAEPPAQRTALLAKLWVPGSAATAEALAANSAAACQLALQAAPPAELAAISLRCNASVIAAASNALADAAS